MDHRPGSDAPTPWRRRLHPLRNARLFDTVGRMDDAPKRSRDDIVAWGIAAHGEPRWPTLLAVVAAIALQLILPDTLIRGLGNRALIPGWKGH